ncbi:Ldh family oxidoreductase [Devosia sp.]|uniref:Ldh family oxidoreductase n=1 Tax=Devosia sp. TaxID=1871048 RepID=UPI001ACBD459|nr:Ldh family oxidoreductase [Devosia sp.]MBN9335776.1 Ldh family oxidoreductase [Devosia sp.]
MTLLLPEKVRSAAREALLRSGVPPGHADIQVDLWLDADLRGIGSHGLLRLPRIVERIKQGLADPKTRGAQTWRGDSFLEVDGQMGLGPVIALGALEAIMDRARQTGVAIAAVGNAQHIGMLAWYAERVASAGQVAIVLSTSEALVHPWGGRQALVGTNPIAIGVPTGEAEPFVMDTATSVVSMGEIHDRANRGLPLEPGWALNAHGEATMDAEAAKAGAIAPFAGAKGYALGLAFELLVSTLTGAALGRDVRGTLDAEHVCNKGDVFIVIDRARAIGIANYLETIRNAVPAEGFDAVLIPGERGRALREKRRFEGVPIADPVWNQIQALAGASEHVQENIL